MKCKIKGCKNYYRKMKNSPIKYFSKDKFARFALNDVKSMQIKITFPLSKKRYIKIIEFIIYCKFNDFYDCDPLCKSSFPIKAT